MASQRARCYRAGFEREAIIMACTITSLILVAFSVIAVGLVDRASLKGSPPTRQDGSPAPSNSGSSARSWSFPGAWWARLRMSAR